MGSGCSRIGVSLSPLPSTAGTIRGDRETWSTDLLPAWHGDVQDVMGKLVGRPLTIGEMLFAVSNCYLRFYKQLEESMARKHKIPMRDGMRCQVPGCSRRGPLHVHHIVHRSQGGSDHPSNLVTVCPAHHLIGIHEGYVNVTGLAPQALVWTLGVRPDGSPYRIFVS